MVDAICVRHVTGAMFPVMIVTLDAKVVVNHAKTVILDATIAITVKEAVILVSPVLVGVILVRHVTYVPLPAITVIHVKHLASLVRLVSVDAMTAITVKYVWCRCDKIWYYVMR